jgi:AcrR family transcriptional regulator
MAHIPSCPVVSASRTDGLLIVLGSAGTQREIEQQMITAQRRVRRTQEQRSTETRKALVEAAVRSIYKLGYGGATTAVIAEEAGISRGSIIFHFSTRAELMAEVLRFVFQEERAEYDRLEREAQLGNHAEDWVEMCWRVLSKPSGVAFLEIQMAARSDLELAEKVAATYESLERTAVEFLRARFGGDAEQNLAAMRLVVWAIRGYSIAKLVSPNPSEIDKPVQLFKQMYHAGIKAGVFGPPPAGKGNT